MTDTYPLASAWNSRVKRHHAQSEAAQAAMSQTRQSDFWKPIAKKFRADPHRTDDSLVNRLARELGPTDTLLDVGGGAGRLALPLALKCKQVTVVEPSESMVEELMAVSGQSGIRNVKVVASPWESAQAKPADVVLCAHVLYGVEDIGTFVRKLNSHARKTVLIVMFLDAPQSHHSQFWKRLHGEERVTLPALKELPPVLWELGIYPNVEMLDAMPPPSYDEREEALHDLRFRLYVAPGSEKDACLLQAIDELLIRTEDGLTLKDTTPRRLGLVRWGKI